MGGSEEISSVRQTSEALTNLSPSTGEMSGRGQLDHREVLSLSTSSHDQGQSVRSAERQILVRQDPELNRAIKLDNIRGLQVGSRNKMRNYFRYQVGSKSVDLVKALKRSNVREALRRLAERPFDSAMERRANRAMTSKPLWGYFDKIRTRERSTRFLTSNGRFAGRVDTRRIVITNSQGVQVGDGLRQDNTYVHIVSGHFDARRILAESADLREEIIRSVTGGAGATHDGESLAVAAGDALEKAIHNSEKYQTAGHIFTTTGTAPIHVASKDAVSIGEHNQQASEVIVTLTAPEWISKSVNRFAADIAPVEDSAEA
jgi:hypothetical protein